MSVGPIGGSQNSIAGSPLAQTHGTEVDRAQQVNTDQAHRTDSDAKAEQASGIGEMEEEHETADRDANGRRPWEFRNLSTVDKNEEDSCDGSSTPDSNGTTGSQLDVRG